MEKDITLRGIAQEWRTHFNTVAVVTVAAIGAATLAGCSDDDPGIAVRGADGKTYILPEDATRPVYSSEQDCVTDIKQAVDNIEEETGDDISEDPAKLCEPITDYDGTSAVVYPRTYYYGPIVSGDQTWSSRRPVAWENRIPSGGFASPNHPVQAGIVEAPHGTAPGSKVVIRGGFGSSAKGGFAHGSGS